MYFTLSEKHDKYGFTSLETLSIWNHKINKNKNKNKNKKSEFTCKKEFSLSCPLFLNLN